MANPQRKDVFDHGLRGDVPHFATVAVITNFSPLVFDPTCIVEIASYGRGGSRCVVPGSSVYWVGIVLRQRVSPMPSSEVKARRVIRVHKTGSEPNYRHIENEKLVRVIGGVVVAQIVPCVRRQELSSSLTHYLTCGAPLSWQHQRRNVVTPQLDRLTLLGGEVVALVDTNDSGPRTRRVA